MGSCLLEYGGRATLKEQTAYLQKKTRVHSMKYRPMTLWVHSSASRVVHPHGPYHLGGWSWSIGCVVSLEVASALQGICK
ncbi:hypothetical protein F5Y14DRAFT_416068 [Nemania sp. NC0429]|nr:hypothetical protein F5Y14DRAFT_416068 [Nemania sp. NC0429]